MNPTCFKCNAALVEGALEHTKAKTFAKISHVELVCLPCAKVRGVKVVFG